MLGVRAVYLRIQVLVTSDSLRFFLCSFVQCMQEYICTCLWIQSVKQGVSRINLLLFKKFVQCMQECICVCLQNQVLVTSNSLNFFSINSLFKEFVQCNLTYINNLPIFKNFMQCMQFYRFQLVCAMRKTHSTNS